MVKMLDNNTTDHPRRTAFNSTVTQKQLSDFVSQHTKQLFTALNIQQQILINTPYTSTGSTDNDYIVGQQKMRSLIVNDAAERRVALIQVFNGVLTSQEEQKHVLVASRGKTAL